MSITLDAHTRLRQLDAQIMHYYLYDPSDNQIDYISDLRKNIIDSDVTMQQLIDFLQDEFRPQYSKGLQAKSERRKFVNILIFGVSEL